METEPGNAAVAVPPQPSAAGPNSNLAIVVDKRPAHRPGGCIGIFFQLFNWNRRLAKKKFFSRKHLPQDRAAKRISKKFASEERMPAATKPAVIAAENRGSFLNIKKVEVETAFRPSVHSSDREKRMISPGLVARLMGLESMPAAARLDKLRKAADDVSTSSGGCCYNDNAGTTSGSPRCEPKLGAESGGSGHGKLQLRPQKLQKLGFFDRRPTSAARVGSEALLFSRSMLARSRKQQYKLASPVKSPRLAGRRNSARLMVAATRILEPGLQSRNRNSCALPYMAPLRATAEGIETTPLQRPSAGTAFVSPCHNCGSLVEVPDLRLKPDDSPAMEYRASSTCSDFSSTSSHSGFDETVSSPTAVQKEKKRTPSLAAQAKANVQSRSHHPVDRKSHPRTEFQEHNKPQLDSAVSPSALRQSGLRQNQMPFVGERVAPASRLGTRIRGKREPSSFNEAKDFVASNRNLSNCPRAKTTGAMVNRRIAMERSSWERKPLVCKGKSIGIHSPSQDIAAVDSPFPKKKAPCSDMPRLMTARSFHGNSVKREVQRMEGGDFGSGSRAAAMHALTGCAGAAGKNSMPHGSVTEKRTWTGVGRGCISESRTVPTNSATGKLSSERVLDNRISTLSVLLEQKIRELTCLDLDKSEASDGVRPTAAILDHLISALSAARAISLKKEDDSAFGLGMQDESCYPGEGPSVCPNSHGPRLDTIHNYQAVAKSAISAGLLRTSDYEQHSPMSILEASFSNDSCLSESFNSSSVLASSGWFQTDHFVCFSQFHVLAPYVGYRQHAVLMENSLDKFPQDLDTDLSDSATSSNFRMVDAAKAPFVLDSVPLVHRMDFNSLGSSGSKVTYFNGVILNAELLFTHTSLNMPPDGAPSTIDPMLLDTLETLVDALGGGHACNLSYREDRDGLQFRSFLFDYIIEHLDMKYSHCAKTGYKTWVKMPFLTAGRLTLEIYEEIISCRDQAGEILDEIVQKEMIRTDGEWMHFLVEAFEAGMEIGNDLLQLLVHEIVIDLVPC
ncbi:hypothetical protein Taro_036008 [Colocasia esculenta]|uniref:DUF4378 domain-containing protein n=1 Tax=Colocasia esculenta TaxID=4460 RepID=A0A843VW60_COLES|nr:hypothetical protein [Colocasia esculenta]